MTKSGFDYAVHAVKSVSAIEAGKALGLAPDRDGRCPCPFHNGVDNNLKLYDGERGFHCFVCHEHGDVIQLVQKCLNCTFTDAVKWLSDTFRLGVDIDKPVDRKTLQAAKKRARMRKELNARIRWTSNFVYESYLDAADFVRQLENAVERHRPETADAEWDNTFCVALRLLPEAHAIAEEAEMLMMEG